MGRVWGEYGESMGRVWGEYEESMGKVWERYGKGMGKVWERYGSQNPLCADYHFSICSLEEWKDHKKNWAKDYPSANFR
jgi:hypothetical protein